MLSQDELVVRAKGCESCIGWLDVCDAECCKLLKIPCPQGEEMMKGKNYVYIRTTLDMDLIRYFSFRDCVYRGGKLMVPLDDAVFDGVYLVVRRECRMLKDNRCLLHGIGKPKICRELEADNVPRNAWLTPRCLFRFKNGSVPE